MFLMHMLNELYVRLKQGKLFVAESPAPDNITEPQIKEGDKE